MCVSVWLISLEPLVGLECLFLQTQAMSQTRPYMYHNVPNSLSVKRYNPNTMHHNVPFFNPLIPSVWSLHTPFLHQLPVLVVKPSYQMTHNDMHLCLVWYKWHHSGNVTPSLSWSMCGNMQYYWIDVCQCLVDISRTTGRI